MSIIPRLPTTPEPCIWCGWLNGEHASRCALSAYINEMSANLEWPPGPNEPGYRPPTRPQPEPFQEAPVKLDCEE